MVRVPIAPEEQREIEEIIRSPFWTMTPGVVFFLGRRIVTVLKNSSSEGIAYLVR